MNLTTQRIAAKPSENKHLTLLIIILGLLFLWPRGIEIILYSFTLLHLYLYFLRFEALGPRQPGPASLPECKGMLNLKYELRGIEKFQLFITRKLQLLITQKLQLLLQQSCNSLITRKLQLFGN